MKLAQKTKQSLLILIALLGVSLFTLPVFASAEKPEVNCNDVYGSGYTHYVDNNGNEDKSICCPNGSQNDAQLCVFAKYANPVIVTLGILTGIAVVIGIVSGAIKYAASGGDPQKAAQGKNSIVKALVGLVAFMFLYSALQFMSPGGIASNPVPTGNGSTVAAQCSKEFLGLKPWFAYLPDNRFEPGTCNIQNFKFFGQGGDIGRVMLAVADDLVRIAGLVAVAFIIVGGIQFVTSQGEAERAKKARQTVINAIIGVIIAIVAAGLVSFIGNQLS